MAIGASVISQVREQMSQVKTSGVDILDQALTKAKGAGQCVDDFRGDTAFGQKIMGKVDTLQDQLGLLKNDNVPNLKSYTENWLQYQESLNKG